MKTTCTCVLFLLLILSPALFGQSKSAMAPSTSFDKMKTLQGSWVGTANEGGKQIPTNARFQLVSDGSALMSWLNEGTPDGMVTVFHMDGKELMATHYCSAHNQPRMVADASSDGNRVVFVFKDGTNIGPSDGHMQQVAIVFEGPDHHMQEWTYVDHGKTNTASFDFHRKK